MKNTPTYFESNYPPTSLETEIAKTLDFVKKGVSSQVLGLPGVGKSRLLRLLAYNKKVRLHHLGESQSTYHFVYMDFSEIRGRPHLEATKFMLISLAYSLSEREFTQESTVINNFLKEAISFQDELVLFQALKKAIDYLALEKNLTIVFLIDRLEQYSQELTEQFFVNLKVLRNRAKYKFSCVFALSRPVDILVDMSTISEFYEYVVGNTVFMKPASHTRSDFRLEYIESVVHKKNIEAKNQILTLTNGHGKLSKIAYELILSEAKNPENMSEFLLSQRQIRGALFEIWNYLTPEEKSHIKVVAKTPQQSESLLFLQHVGLIDDDHIAIPIFKDFLGTFTEEKESFTFDPERNEITKGSVNLTELLTPSEFRLLKHLIINKGKVCDKEEIITAVWRDTQTQEGVTDQALDQIVYRLRKKVEADPNNPIYIVTVKGKGIKLAE